MTITQIQLLLAYLGLYTMEADGIWGTCSKAACREFQRKMGIGADGIPGSETQAALKKAVANGLPEEQLQEEDAGFWNGIKHFARAEFECSCGCGYDSIDHRLVTICEDIREAGGVPMDISSGCRCKVKNASLPGAAPNSRHIYGRAVDFRLRGKTSAQTLAIVKADKRVAYCYAIDGAYVHMDITA